MFRDPVERRGAVRDGDLMHDRGVMLTRSRDAAELYDEQGG
jgi:hypothetical protein